MGLIELGNNVLEKMGLAEGIVLLILFAVWILRLHLRRRREQRPFSPDLKQALHQRENNLDSVFRAVPAGIGVVINRSFLKINDSMCTMTGYSREEFLGHEARFLYPTKDEYDYVGREYARIGHPGVISLETRWKRKDGTLIDVLLNLAPIHPKNISLGISFTAIDITDRKRSEESLGLDNLRFQALVNLNSMTDAPMKDLTDFALEEAVRLTRSKIGYVAFANEDESILTMYSWSRTAMAECGIREKPLVYPVVTTGLWGEAVRRRKPIITNDYPAPNPLKKGFPEGHVEILRHMNAPIFDKGKIVIVAGVGNKEEPYDEKDINQLTLLMQGLWKHIQQKQAEEEIQRLNTELEQRVIERTTQLEAANKELEAFSYSVSHDLRAPLRIIDGFSHFLLEEFSTQLPPDAQTYLEKISDNVRLMAQLIDSLLSLSRLTRQPLEKQTLNMVDLVRQVLSDLQTEQQGRKIEISIGELPSAQADPALLRQVWFNLLSNAIKYTRGREVAQIEIGCQTQDGHNVFFVRDNGAGFDMQHASRLFEVFQRLHSEKEFEGIGAGLAIVQRILHRHGGRAWAQAKVDKGATFYFTL
jgi:two-component system, OmpR family, phosphate regulon sensor histidine kinase PhoR